MESDFKMPSYPAWEKRFRELTDSGVDVVTAWAKTHKEFGMAKDEIAAWEQRMGVTL